MAAEMFEREYRTKLCQLSVGDGKCRVESEVILPDYKEEAQRIIRVNTKARVNSKNTYVRGSYLICEVEGVVSFHLLYLTDRRGERGSLSSFVTQENFSYTFKTALPEDWDQGGELLCFVETAS